MIEKFSPNSGHRNPLGKLLYGLIIQSTIKQAAVSVGVAATLLPTTALQYRKSLVIFNNGTSPIYIGDASVSTADGLPIYPRGELNIQIEDSVDVYAISSVAGQDIRLCEGA